MRFKDSDLSNIKDIIDKLKTFEKIILRGDVKLPNETLKLKNIKFKWVKQLNNK